MHICMFKDEFYTQLLPLVFMRPVYDLKCGQLTLREKIARFYPDETFVLHLRDYLRDSVKERHPGAYINEIPAEDDRLLMINGRIIFGADAAVVFNDGEGDVVHTDGDIVLGAWLSGKNLGRYRNSIGKSVVTSKDFGDIRRVETNGLKVVRYPWDLIHMNGSQLVSDFGLCTTDQAEILGKVYEGA